MKYQKEKLQKDLYDKMYGQTLRDVQPKVRLSIATISRIQNGGTPDLLSYAKICKFLGSSLDKYVK